MTLCDVCAAEGYPYNEETCKDCEYNSKQRGENQSDRRTDDSSSGGQI